MTPEFSPDPWWTYPETRWWALLFIYIALGIFFLVWGERDAAKVAFGMVIGQASSGGWTAIKPKGT